MTSHHRRPVPPLRARSLQYLMRVLAFRPVNTALKAIVSLVLIVVVCRKVPGYAIWQQFQTQSVAWLGIAALLTASQILLGSLRWHQVLRALGERLPPSLTLRITYTSSFFNAWLFGVVGGDAARAMLAPVQRQGRGVLVHSVLFDRVLTLGGLGLVVVPGVVLGLRPFGRDPAVLLALGAALAPIVGLTIAASAARRLPETGSRLLHHIVAAARSWRCLLRAPHRFLATLAIAVASQLALAAVAYTLARAQHLDVSFADFAMLMPPVVLLATLPISAGGWGVREGAMVAMLSTIGVASEPALLISVEMGALAALISLPAGALWAFRYGRRLRPVAAAS